MTKNNVVARALSQKVSVLPSFIKENYPKFVNFLRAYYEWSATEGPDLIFEALKLSNDIDLVIEDLLPSYRSSYAKHFPVELKTNFRHFAKFLKEFYQLKGTNESFRLFFKAVFNEEATIYYPKEQILKPSSAIWNKQTYFKVEALEGNPFDLINKEIVGLNNGYKAIVSDVVKVGNYYDVYFEDALGDFEIDEIIKNGETIAKIVPIHKIVSFSSNQSWYDSSVIHVNGLVLKVDKINYGRIINLNIINGGSDYAEDDLITVSSDYLGSGFKAKVKTVDSSGAITSVAILSNGFGYNHDYVTIDIHSSNGHDAVLEPVFDSEFRKIKSLSIIQNKEYTNSSPYFDVNLPDGTQIRFSKGVTNTIKYWVETKSEPSSEFAKIHDSNYYQDFSYEIQSAANAREYKDSLRALLHITGFGMFIKTLFQEKVNAKTRTILA